jgi:uncharacterized membrane protein YbhN (UPF0104 family)
MERRPKLRTAIAEVRSRLSRRWLIAAGVVLLAIVAVFTTPHLLGSHLSEAVDTLGSADPKWLWISGVGFVLAFAAAAGSWRSAIGLTGGHVSFVGACARYGAGSFVNTFVPARAGDAVRLALFSRSIENDHRLLSAASAFALLGAVRAVVIGALVVAGALAGAVPLWPLLVAAGLALAAVILAIVSRRTQAHILDAFRAVSREPAGAARLLGWMVLSTLGRLLSAAAIGAALGIRQPLAAAIVIVPALDIASLVPLTPGNIGVTSGAIAVAFEAHGVSLDQGLAAGIAFHAVETAVGLMFGIASLVWLAPYHSPQTRRRVLLGGAAAWALALGGTFTATVLSSLV